MAAEHSPDGRYIVVDGRRWRATDPNIPAGLRDELVAALMAARRATRSGGPRSHVQDAKVALGERGEPWWEPPTPDGQLDRCEATIRALLRHRAADVAVTPTEVARVAAGTRWRSATGPARHAAGRLQGHNIVRVTQRGEDVDAHRTAGRLRIARGPSWPG